MKYIIYFLTALLNSLSNIAFGQEGRLISAGIETGIDFIGCDTPVKNYIRGDFYSYYPGYVNETEANSLGAQSRKFYTGARIEWMSNNSNLGISAGIRYTRLSNSIICKTNSYDSPDYYFVLFRRSGTSSEYLRVKELKEGSDYLGIPVGIRFFPGKTRNFPFKSNTCRIYFKSTVEFNFLISSSMNVVFFNEAMNPYEEAVSQLVGEPKSFFSALDLAAGLRINKPPMPLINIEATVLCLFLTSDVSDLVSPIAGGGVQLDIQIPF